MSREQVFFVTQPTLCNTAQQRQTIFAQLLKGFAFEPEYNFQHALKIENAFSAQNELLCLIKKETQKTRFGWSIGRPIWWLCNFISVPILFAHLADRQQRIDRREEFLGFIWFQNII